VLSDIFGHCNEENQRLSRFIADNGFLTLLPDLFRNQPWNPQDDRSGLDEWRKLHPRDRVMEDVQTTVKILRDLGAEKVGAVGFCWGGELALHCSTVEGLLETVVGFYPTQMNPEEGAGVKVPALFIFGQQDAHIPINQVEAFSAAARHCPLALAIRMYSGCGHGFAHRLPQPSQNAASPNNSGSNSREESKGQPSATQAQANYEAGLEKRAGETVRRELAAWLQVHLDHEPSIDPVGAEEWWPEGWGLRFHNRSLEAWEDLRLRWRVPIVPRPPAPPPVNYDSIVDGLSSRVRTFVLPGRMKLADIIEMFNDVWELENGY